MRRYRLILPWAALGGLLIAVGALLVVRSGTWVNERILLWPTYQLFRLDRLSGGGPWAIVFFFLTVQALIWTVLLAGGALVTRWARSLGGKRHAA